MNTEKTPRHLENSSSYLISHRVSVVLLSIALLFLVSGAGLQICWASTAIAENVIVLVIDGIRNDEAFDDPTHQYIPHIWNDLVPLGTICTNFWNTGFQTTTAGHLAILTGVREHLCLGEQNRSKYPNVFEYYRKATGAE